MQRAVVFIFILLAGIGSVLLLSAQGLGNSGVSQGSWSGSCYGLFKADFSTYWVWVRYWIGGHNPYETDQLRVYAQSLNCTLTGTHYVPPFIVPLLVPIMIWPLTSAAVLWAALNLAMVAYIARETLRDSPSRGHMRGLPEVTILLFSPPTAACIAYGQFGIVSAWIMFVASRVALRPASTLPGLLTLAALKPHLGYIYWLGFFADLIRRRAWGICVATGGFMLLLTVLVETLTPGAIVAWCNGAGGALTWMGASPVTYVRMVFRMPNSSPPLWPVLIGAMFAIGLAIWHLIRQGRWFDREKDLALFTTLSLCATPYLWCLDFSVLLLAELSVLAPGGADATSHIRSRLAAGIVMMARIAIALQMVLGVVDYRTGWYPLAILLALILAGSSAESRTFGNARGRMAVARNCKA